MTSIEIPDPIITVESRYVGGLGRPSHERTIRAAVMVRYVEVFTVEFPPGEHPIDAEGEVLELFAKRLKEVLA